MPPPRPNLYRQSNMAMGGGYFLFVPTKPDLVTGGGAGGTKVEFGWKFSSTCWYNSAGSETVGVEVAEKIVSVTRSQPGPPAGAVQTRVVLVVTHSTPLQTTNLSTLVWGTSGSKMHLGWSSPLWIFDGASCTNTRMSGASSCLAGQAPFL
jgi:hypothetical protein